MLYQLDESGGHLPVAFHSKPLTKAERNWKVGEKELYGIIEATRKFAPYCVDKINLHTDHEPLKSIRKKKDPRGKIARWLCELEHFDYRVHYVNGKDNKVADCLSRVEDVFVFKDGEEVLSISIADIKKHQDLD